MRKLTYRVLFILVGTSVLADVASWLTLWTGLGVGLAATPLVWFSNPVPTAILVVVPNAHFLFSQPIVFGLRALMLFIVLRRLIFIIRMGSFMPPASFSVGLLVMALIGLGAVAVAVTLLAAMGFFPTPEPVLGLRATLLFGVAMFVLPLALLITEVLSFGKRSLVQGSQ